MQRAPSAPKRTASQRAAAAASAAASSPSASPDMSDEGADAAAASFVPGAAPASVTIAEPETPRKRARRGSAKALAAAAADAEAGESGGDGSPSAAAAVSAASPKPRRKKSGAASSPKVSRSKSTPAAAAAMDVEDESKEPAVAAGAATDAAGTAAGGDEAAESPAVPAKKPRARSVSGGGAKAKTASGSKKKGGKAAAASQDDGDEDMAAALSRSASQSSMGGSQDGDDDGSGGGGGGNYSPHATALLAVESQKRANRPEGSHTIMCWNVNGLRAALKNGAGSYFNQVDADVIALCEVKADAETVKREFEHVGETHAPSRSASSGPLAAMFAGATAPPPPKYHKFWNCSATKKGYSGTAIFSKRKPVSVVNGIGHKVHDEEGRVITAEFDDYYLVVSYVPNAGQKLERLSYRTEEWDAAMLAFLQSLQSNGKGKHVVWTGDLNVCHQEHDIHAPKTNRKSAGFTAQERAGFDRVVGHPTVIQAKRNAAAAAAAAAATAADAAAASSSSAASPSSPASAPALALPSGVPHGAGFVDVFDRLYPTELNRFTYWGHRWSARSTHKGWRLDYFVVSEAFMDTRVHDCWIGSELTEGDKGGRRSDHAPIFLCIK